MTGDETQPDRQLVVKVIGGNKTAFAHLVRPQVGRLITLAIRMLGSRADAEEVVQDALASVWMARHRLDPNRESAPFLTTTVLNKCRDRLRRRKAAGLFGMAPKFDELSLPDQEPDPERRAVGRDGLARLQQEIERLPVRLREALVLVAIESRSQDEAARLLGVTEKTIETRIYRARKRLREKFEDF